MKQERITMRIFLMCLLAVLSLCACKDDSKKEIKVSPCEGRQWKSSKEELECRYPNPPIGRWHAVYTEDFAKRHSLPSKNISGDLSLGVDYMEMDVQPYGKGGVSCLVNMLIKKPNDVAVYNKGDMYKWGPELHANRKLAHMIDLEEHKDKLRGLTTFGLTSRDNTYDPQKSYSIGSSFAFYGENILDGYDYITADASCYHLISKKELFPDGFAFNFAKASIWGKHAPFYKGMDEPGRPEGKEFFDSRDTVNIPQELILNVFQDMPIGGR